MDEAGKKLALSEIMGAAHALAEVAWPRDAGGNSDMPQEAVRALIDVQIAAAKALGLPDDLDLMTGDALFDVT